MQNIMDGLWNVKKSFILLENRIVLELLSFWADVSVQFFMTIYSTTCFVGE